jgi:hypothetical protein
MVEIKGLAAEVADRIHEFVQLEGSPHPLFFFPFPLLLSFGVTRL